MESFNLGIFVTDRQEPNYFQDLHQVSLVWSQPNVLISLVEKAPNLTSLSLFGYNELMDLALEFIAGNKNMVTILLFMTQYSMYVLPGRVGKSPGLTKLTKITLPKKCFVTPNGIRALLESLPMLEIIENQGKMGALLSRRTSTENVHPLEIKFAKPFLSLKEFCQMEFMGGGAIDENNTDNLEQMIMDERESWEPTEEVLAYIMKTCPRLTW